ncbi:TonB-dependent receptor [Algoriphagus halophilus]|uniref:Outer membrane receptor for ferrienterochelin and colicins n=1 Tax=Algoriphagus halophilus TaxID=226505 RepID=A0A1N6EAP4_9BACT|nr:TonB-dependent receptor [Algoriphagus halophilus]SIN80041.1 outer membrane receptor for ferrienterochelin and colicins [Algoriphagus halophilus]
MFRFSLNKIIASILSILFWFPPVLAQEKARVISNSGETIPFATIQVMNGKGITTDLEGRFDLDQELRNKRFQILALGHQSKWYYLTDHDTITVFKLKEEINELDPVVVTGNYEPQSARNSVYQVRSIEKETLQNRASTTIQEALNTQLGIRFSQDNALGSSNMELLGLSGQNVKILVDGVPMVGRQGTSNEININQIDVNRIERIEIVEGPMSVVYGADALAGVINIITKKDLGNTWSLSARIQEETVGSEYQPFTRKGNHTRSVSGNYGMNKWNFGASFSQNNFGGWKGKKTGRDYEWLPKDQIFLNLSASWTGKSFYADYQLDYLDETVFSYGADARFEILDQQFITSRWMHRISGRWESSNGIGLTWQGAYTDYSRDSETWVTQVYSGEKYQSQAEGANSTIHYQGFTWRMMVDWKLGNTLRLNPGVDIHLEKGAGERIVSNDGIRDYAVFLSAEWVPNPKISIKPGIRKTWNSAYEAPPIIPSINSKWNLSDQLAIRFAYAYGFRAPSTRELYFNFFDASHRISGNPNLKAENSNSFNGSLDWKKQVSQGIQLKTVLSGFYNDLSNRIAYAQDPDNMQVTTLINVDRYKTTGLTLGESLSMKNWNFNLGFSYIGRYNQLSQEESNLPAFVWTPEITSDISYQIKPWKTTASLFYKWTGSLPGYEISLDENGNPQPKEIELDGYQWMDLTFKKEIRTNLNVHMGIKNLFNITQINSSSESGAAHGMGSQRPIGYGRSYFLGLTYQLKN